MGLIFVLALLALVFAALGSALGRGSYPTLLIGIAAALLAVVHLVGSMG